MGQTSFQQLDHASAVHQLASQIGSRLRGEIRSFLESLPREKRKAADLIRWLRLHPALVYRVVAGAKHSGDPIGVLLVVPGLEGFRMFLEASRRRGVNPARLRSLAAAVDAYASCIDEMGGGSQAQLRTVVESWLADSSRGTPDRTADEATETPAGLSRVALSQALGRSAIATVAMQLYLPSIDDAGYIEATTISGKVGLSGLQSGVPIRFATAVVGADEEHRPVEQVSGLLESFCTPGLKRTSVEPTGASRIEIVEPPDASVECDIFSTPRRTPRASKLPPDDNDGVLNCGIVMNVPSRWLVYDVYLHRSFAGRCVPEISVFAPSPLGPLSGHPSKRWHERIADPLTLQVLGHNPQAVRTAAYSRFEELTAYLFEQAHQSPANFVGYRCLVGNPYWGASYVMTFDFGTGKDA